MSTIHIGNDYVFDGNVTFRGNVTGLMLGEGRVTYGAASPTSGWFGAKDIIWNSSPAAGGVLGWVCLQRLDTQAKTLAAATAVNIDVDDTTGMAADDIVGILLDILSGGNPTGAKEMLWTHINSVTDADTIVIHDAIPANRRAPVDAPVYTMRFKALPSYAA